MKMEIIGPFLLSFLAGLSTLLGTLFIYINIKKVGEYIVFFLSFSMGIMIFISIFDLLPSSIIVLINNYKYFYGLLISILIFILGYLSVDLINNKINKKNTSPLYSIGLLSLISLIIHNIPEGILVFMTSYTSFRVGFKMFLAIMLHNIPEGISIAIPLYYGGESRGRVIGLTLISGLSEPLGALLSYIFLKRVINEIIISYLLLFVAGLMISLSINNIYKEIIQYRIKNKMIQGLTLSIIISIIVLFI